MSLRIAGRFVLVLLFGSMLAACGDTWSGLKQDTGENMETVGESVTGAGEKVQESGEEEEAAQ